MLKNNCLCRTKTLPISCGNFKWILNTLPYTGPATEKQLEIRKRFKSKQKAVIAWLRANRATADRPATEAYLIAYALKRRYVFSSINQVVYKYLNENLEVVLPNIDNDAAESGLGA